MNKFTKFAISAAAVTFASSAAFAAPMLTMTIESAGATSAECAAGSGGTGTFSGSTCTMTTGSGALVFGAPTLSYGAFQFTDAEGVGAGTGGLAQSQPSLWLDNLAGSNSPGSLTVTLTASGYSMPSSPFQLLSTYSATSGPGITQTLSHYFDADDNGVAGMGTELFSEALTGPGSSSGNFFNVLTYVDTYSLSWILEINRTSGTTNQTAGVSTTTYEVPLPAPAPIAIMGLGLLGLGFLRRKA